MLYLLLTIILTVSNLVPFTVHMNCLISNCTEKKYLLLEISNEALLEEQRKDTHLPCIYYKILNHSASTLNSRRVLFENALVYLHTSLVPHSLQHFFRPINYTLEEKKHYYFTFSINASVNHS